MLLNPSNYHSNVSPGFMKDLKHIFGETNELLKRYESFYTASTDYTINTWYLYDKLIQYQTLASDINEV